MAVPSGLFDWAAQFKEFYLMNNKTAVTSDYGKMWITHHSDIKESVTDDRLFLGRHESTKRGLFRKKTINRPLVLSVAEIFQHIAVYAESWSDVDYWLMDKAYQVMRLDWSVLYMDFRWCQGSLNRWNSAIPGSCFYQKIASSNDNIAEILTGNKVAYFCANDNTIPAFARAVSDIMTCTVSGLHNRSNTLVILNGVPTDAVSVEAVTRLIAQCRVAKIGLILRFMEHIDADFQAKLDADVRTKVEFVDNGVVF
jgi:hypothetical protein